MDTQMFLTSFEEKANIGDPLSRKRMKSVSQGLENSSDFTSSEIVLDSSIDEISEKNAFLQLPQQIFSPYRIMILIALWRFGSLDFSVLRDDIHMKSDGNLANHLRVLEDLDLIKYRKEFVDRRPKTFYELTEKGKVELNKLLSGLRESIRGLDEIVVKK